MLGDSSRQLGNLFWRGRCPASLQAAPRALILTLLCKGFLCQLAGFTLTAPGSVSVQRGLCVLISCDFVFPESSYSYSYYYQNDKMQGYWYKSPIKIDLDSPVATNDERRPVSAETRGRFRLVGNPEEGSCSLSIEDAREGDTGQYFFRIERGRLKYTYPSWFQVSVTELTEEPEMLILPVLVPGKPIKVTCWAPGTCSGTPPQITWMAEFSYTESASEQFYRNGSQVYSSIIDFTPFPEDQGKLLTCRVTYPAAQAAATQKTIRLHIDFSVPWEAGSDSISIVTREGDSLSLVCEAESSPSSSLNWTKGNETLSSSSSILGRELRLELLNVTAGDAGEYQCRAENPYGSANRTLRVHVQFEAQPSGMRLRPLVEVICKGLFMAAGFLLAYYLPVCYYWRSSRKQRQLIGEETLSQEKRI
uniref:Ig-like domain-containing protein n=1 Tax=Sphenodon punctatus TaxID=8508 RepID=A0A8D0HBE0_SPHPU